MLQFSVIPTNNSIHSLECMFLFDAGFMMECSSWSGAESLNLQFMVPKVRILLIIFKFVFACK